MQNEYLLDLINQVQALQGGLVLHVGETPAVVVLSMERYKELLGQTARLLESAVRPEATPRNILVTGGAGYVGTHVVRQLLGDGHQVVVLDNLSTGDAENVPARATLVEGDVRDASLLQSILREHHIEMVIHLAASIEAAESLEKPVEYLYNNALATIGLLRVMEQCGVKKIIFASTAAVYGTAKTFPIPETARPRPADPYAQSKLMAEQAIQFFCRYRNFQAIVFRYFTVAGTNPRHPAVDSHSMHLFPAITQVLSGQREFLTVFGKDHETFDQTCVRDFIHAEDVARAHTLALEYLETSKNDLEKLSRPSLKRCQIFNLGTGQGVSVLQLIQAISEQTGHMVPLEIGLMRPGDLSILVADTTKIRKILGFVPQFSSLENIIITACSNYSIKVQG